VPSTTAQRVLDDLVDAGIVTTERLGPAIGYQLNRWHLVVQAITELARGRRRTVCAPRHAPGDAAREIVALGR
jgi:hypothetical protein